MKARYAALLLVLFVCGAGPAAAMGKGAKGTAGAQFLKLSPGARPAAMGDAFGGVADDLHAIHYNPAGLGNLQEVEVGAMHDSHFQGIRHNFGALAVPLLSWVDTRRQRNAFGTLAFSVTSLSVGDIERRGLVETDEPNGTFSAEDRAYTLGYGLSLPRRVSLGAAVKLIEQRLDSASARTAAVDAGGLFQGDRLSVGAGVRNLGGKLRFVSEADPLPLTAYLGGGWKAGPGWLAAAELRLPNDDAPRLSLGGEYRRGFSRELRGALRAGYNMSSADGEGFDGITVGAGVAYGKAEFDFAWVAYGALGNSFRYSLRTRF
ncbi:MAG: hypothetical protein A2X36_13360 [Elusimicrobia bacterium GWA2_69_24]|nr:MAG: hypothetical protein A2X36_13360 [Elusimicrobia bacterium GWA2_69_24]HBL15750.1 hypothetical protein [Elusimicrobiota bacterium]